MLQPLSSTPIDLLTSQGIAVIPDLYDQQTIKEWNTLFDQIFIQQSGDRRYVSALQLYELGIFNSLFSKTLQQLILSIIPDAELYHCHVYEISGNKSKPHIAADNKLNGWHRDVDCKHQIPGPKVQHISLFVYLSDVANNGGYFEVSNKSLLPPEFGNQDTHYQLIEDCGTCFLFDRKAYHRASPNNSCLPRRVLKLSFQSRKLFNHKQQEALFIKVKNQLSNENDFIRQLFGDKIINTSALQETLSSKHNVIASLPEHHKTSEFTPWQNAIRYIRDLRFILRRLAAKYSLVNDKKMPPPKIKSS